jgi:hypothetical protein
MNSNKTSNDTSTTDDKVHEFYMKCYAQLDEFNDKTNNLYTTMWSLLDMKRHYKRGEEYYEIHGEYPPIIDAMLHGKKRQRLVKKYFVELTNLELLRDELGKKSDKLEKITDNIGVSFIHENSKMQKITNKNKKQLQRDTCSICCDSHKINKMITTCCGHHFGTYCFAKYIDINYDNNNDIVCPLCRNDKLEYFIKYH